MPRSKRKKSWSKHATTTGVVLGLVASIPMNLLSAWLQKDVVINLFYVVLVILLLAALIYFDRKKRTPELLNTVFWLLVVTVSLNLFSTLIEMEILQDKFTLSNVTVILSLCVIVLATSALLQSHFYRRFKQRVIMKRKWSARNMRLASERSENPEQKVKVKKRMPRQKRRL